MSPDHLSRESLHRFEALVDQTLERGQTVDWLVRQIRDHGETLGWHDAFEYRVPSRRKRRASVILRACSIVRYAEMRRQQLAEGDFDIWVYRSSGLDDECPGTHRELDGIALPPDHAFWRIWSPPNCLLCRCHLAGARSEIGPDLVGGDPDKPLPDWWDDPAQGPALDFVGDARPTFARIFELAMQVSDE